MLKISVDKTFRPVQQTRFLLPRLGRVSKGTESSDRQRLRLVCLEFLLFQRCRRRVREKRNVDNNRRQAPGLRLGQMCTARVMSRVRQDNSQSTSAALRNEAVPES
jgi:hypothetical protein